MGVQPEGERKNDTGRPSFREQGPHFIFQSSFYTLSNVAEVLEWGAIAFSEVKQHIQETDKSREQALLPNWPELFLGKKINVKRKG